MYLVESPYEINLVDRDGLELLDVLARNHKSLTQWTGDIERLVLSLFMTLAEHSLRICLEPLHRHC